jgi:hypothetical protein
MAARNTPQPRGTRNGLRLAPALNLLQLVSVYTAANLVTAEIIQNALRDEGIRCFIEGANQAAHAGLTAMEIKIEVPIADADRARKIIETHPPSYRGTSDRT